MGEQYRRVLVPAVEPMRASKLAAGDAPGVRISDSILYLAEVMGRAPVLVVPCFHFAPGPDEHLAQIARMYGSTFPAIWSLQLALRSRGLGSALTTAHLLDEPAMAEILGIPAGWSQIALAAPGPRDRRRLLAVAAPARRGGRVVERVGRLGSGRAGDWVPATGRRGGRGRGGRARGQGGHRDGGRERPGRRVRPGPGRRRGGGGRRRHRPRGRRPHGRRARRRRRPGAGGDRRHVRRGGGGGHGGRGRGRLRRRRHPGEQRGLAALPGRAPLRPHQRGAHAQGVAADPRGQRGRAAHLRPGLPTVDGRPGRRRHREPVVERRLQHGRRALRRVEAGAERAHDDPGRGAGPRRDPRQRDRARRDDRPRRPRRSSSR